MKKFIIVFCFLVLCACTSPEEDIANIKKSLPAGCEFHHLPDYQDEHISVVICDNNRITSTSIKWNETYSDGTNTWFKTHHNTINVKWK